MEARKATCKCRLAGPVAPDKRHRASGFRIEIAAVHDEASSPAVAGFKTAHDERRDAPCGIARTFACRARCARLYLPDIPRAQPKPPALLCGH